MCFFYCISKDNKQGTRDVNNNLHSFKIKQLIFLKILIFRVVIAAFNRTGQSTSSNLTSCNSCLDQSGLLHLKPFFTQLMVRNSIITFVSICLIPFIKHGHETRIIPVYLLSIKPCEAQCVCFYQLRFKHRININSDDVKYKFFYCCDDRLKEKLTLYPRYNFNVKYICKSELYTCLSF